MALRNMTLLSLKDYLISKAGWVILGTVLSLLGPTIVGGIVHSVQERITFDLLVKQIEWTRLEAERANCDIPFLVVGLNSKVMEWDLRITYEQEANRHILTDIWSPDAWNNIKLIPLPCPH